MINIKLTINRMKHIVSSSLYLEAGPVPEVLWLVCFILFLVEVVLIINTCTCYVSFTIVMEILLNCMFNFGIKMCPKLPNSLTIRKPDVVDRLSVANFAATIKLNAFDDFNYKLCRELLILWLTVVDAKIR